MKFCEKCPAPHQCAQEQECLHDRFIAGTHNPTKALQIPRDVIDDVVDALEAGMTKAGGIHDEVFEKLGAAHLRLEEAIQDAEATEP